MLQITCIIVGTHNRITYQTYMNNICLQINSRIDVIINKKSANFTVKKNRHTPALCRTHQQHSVLLQTNTNPKKERERERERERGSKKGENIYSKKNHTHTHVRSLRTAHFYINLKFRFKIDSFQYIFINLNLNYFTIKF